MDGAKFSRIGHTALAICNPLSDAKLDRALAELRLTPGANLLDVGAGKGELLIRAIERYGARGTAVELDAERAAEARARAAGRIPAGALAVVAGDGADFVRASAPGAYDVAMCLGSTHAFGGYEATLEALPRAVRPGGLLLLAEGFWQRRPDPEFLAFLGDREDSLGSHADNVLRAERRGLVPLWAAVASADEWDAYEWAYSRALEDYAHEHPDDPDVPALLERIRGWRTAVLRWGRDAFGFGLYLFRKPGP